MIRATTADLLSEYFGVSDRKIDAFFSEIETLAAEEFVVASGEKVRLPLVVILEEAEGLTHRRGGADGGVYDRIIGILLQRLDDPIHDLSKLPIFFITTTNRGDMVDVAAWRRLAGVNGALPPPGLSGDLCGSSEEAQAPFSLRCRGRRSGRKPAHRSDRPRRGQLYSPNGSDQPLVEITLRDGKRVLRYFRDFLTGAICEQAISNAIDEIVFSIDESGDTRLGLGATAVIDCAEERDRRPGRQPNGAQRCRLRRPSGRFRHGLGPQAAAVQRQTCTPSLLTFASMENEKCHSNVIDPKRSRWGRTPSATTFPLPPAPRQGPACR